MVTRDVRCGSNERITRLTFNVTVFHLRCMQDGLAICLLFRAGYPCHQRWERASGGCVFVVK